MKAALVLLACLGLWLEQACGGVVNYRGRLSLKGAYPDGIGRFKFALIGEGGSALWSSAEIPLSISNGAYAVRLGDSAQAPSIPEAALLGKTPPKLRIWFLRENQRWALVGPDITLTDERPAKASIDVNQGAAILAELHELRALLAGNNPGGSHLLAPENVTVSTANAPSLGSENASLVLVEFTDFQCPYCIQFNQETFGALKRDYADRGKLRIVSRNLPLPMHQFAEAAARAAHCADAQGKFWPMRDLLFAANGGLGPESIAQFARTAGLDPGAFEQCSANAETAAALQKEIQEAKAAGIEATPSFVLGKPNGNKVTGLKITGALPLADFEAEIDKLLPPEPNPERK
jgi:protein-disulfide isomerase